MSCKPLRWALRAARLFLLSQRFPQGDFSSNVANMSCRKLTIVLDSKGSFKFFAKLLLRKEIVRKNTGFTNLATNQLNDMTDGSGFALFRR